MRFVPRLFLHLAGLVWIISLATLPALAQTPGTETAEIIFDRKPQQHGMDFENSGVRYAPVTFGGKQFDAWVAEKPHDSHRLWERTWRLKVNDPKYFDGKYPSVDIEITYHLPGWGSVEVYVATAGGKARHVGGGWGDSHGWKTMRLRMDDACFSNDEKNGEGLGPFDLRVTGSNAPVYLRKVKLTFYDPQKNVVWDRLLKIENFAAETPGGVLAFEHKPTALGLKLHNFAFIDRPVRYHLDIQDLGGQTLHSVDNALVTPAKDVADIRMPFDPSRWPLGPYKGQFAVLVDDKPVLTQSLRLGVISSTVLDKARDDEYFYGIDAANSNIYRTDTPAAAAYYRMMGVDFLRSLPIQGELTTNSLKNAVQFIQNEKLRAAVFFEPPRPARKDGPMDQKELDRRAAQLADVVRQYGGRALGRIFVVELGNEPDLPFFWNAPLSLYVQGMNTLAASAREARQKAGLKPGDFLIANGGLSFAGTTGDQHARELVKLFDPSMIDLLAYHGHGLGIGAERSAYERLRGAVKETAVKDLKAIETETGFSANSDASLIDQARTAVQKNVYAQSVGLPGLIFFRLFMEGEGTEGGYGLTEHLMNPRPSVLSYRTMVEHLRHRRYVREIDTSSSTTNKGVHLYLFEETQEGGAVTGRKTLVAFAETPSYSELAIRLDGSGAAPRNAEQCDMFGNAKPATLLPGGIVQLPVTADAVYLSWEGSALSSATELIPPLLAIQEHDPLMEGTVTPVGLTVRNPGPQPMQATLTIAAQGSVPLEVTPATQTLELTPNGQAAVPLNFKVAASSDVFSLPRWWRVFPDADEGQLKGGNWSSLPQTLKKRDGTSVTGTQLYATENRLEFSKPFGSVRERRPAIGMAYLDAPRETVLHVGASADWYMEWFVNGKSVYSTMAQGNVSGGLLDHQFDLPLKAGRNLVAFVCASGSQGWNIQFGGPRELQLAQPGAQPLDHMRVTLNAGGKQMAELVAPLTLASVVPPLGTSAVSSLESWNQLEPMAVMDADKVQNLFFKEPDASRWYQGPRDLSSVVWLRDDTEQNKVMLTTLVRDDKHVPGTLDQLDGHDNVHCIIADDAGGKIVDIVLSTAGQTGVSNGIIATAVREERAPDGAATLYQISIPRALLQASTFRISLRVSDDDGFGLKQTAELGSLAEPARGVRCRLKSN